MKRIFKIVLPIVALVLLFSAPFAQAQFTFESSYNVPYVTNGIEYVDGYIYTHYINFGGPNEIQKWNPADSSFVSSFNTPVPLAHDLAWDGQYFWSDQTNNDTIYQFDMSGNVISSIQSATTTGAGSMGLTYDGTNLWSVLPTQWGGDGIIRQLDTSDGTVLASINSPATNMMGLDWYNSSLWTISAAETSVGSGVYESTIWQLDPTDGSVMNSFVAPLDPSMSRPHDLVWDDQGYLWVTADDLVPGQGGSVQQVYKLSYTPSVVPEPISSTLFIVGGATLGFRRFQKKRRTA